MWYDDMGGIMLMLFMFISGCIPIPRELSLQPRLYPILDDEKNYISNAQVVFVTLSNPHNNG